MNTERWRRIEELFDEAVELAPEDQDAFLQNACPEDAELRKEVRALLDQDRSPGGAIAEAIDLLCRTPPPPPMEFEGRRAGPFRIVREIGRGGMGIVFEAVRDDDQFQQRVALKVAAKAAFAPEFLERFRHERQILAGLEHPHIARLLDGGTTEEEIPYFAMEFVEGEPVHQYASRRNLSIADRLKLFFQVCDAVEYAHRNLIIHRDLKPGNILVAGDNVKLLDFGIAKLIDPSAASLTTTSGAMPVTPDYCSPEQIRGERITTQTDVYSLGLVLFELLTGERAQLADTSSPLALHRSICEAPLGQPSQRSRETGNAALARALQGDLDLIIQTAAHKDPARRYPSVAALRQDLRNYLERRPITARQDSRIYRMSKFARRNWTTLTAAALVLITLIGGIFAARYQANRAERRFAQVRRIAKALMVDVHDAIEHLPASTKAREVVLQTALEYLDNLAKEAGSDRTLQLELAEGYLRVAELTGSTINPSLGRAGDAKGSYVKAKEIVDHLLARYPDDLDISVTATRVYSKYGNALSHAGQTTEGVRLLLRAIEFGENAALRYQQDPKWRYELGNAYSNLLEFMEYGPESHRHAKRYVQLAEQYARLQPETFDSLTQLGVAYSQAGRVLLETDKPLAARYFRQNLETQQKALALEPDNSSQHRNLILAFANLGDIALGPLAPDSYTGPMGPPVAVDPQNLARALEAYASAIRHAEWRSERDSSAAVRFDHALTLGRGASAYPPGDLRAIAQLLEAISRLKDLDKPSDGRSRIYTLEFKSTLAERYRQSGRFADAVANWEECEALALTLLREKPDMTTHRSMRLRFTLNRALAHADRKDRRAAVAMATRALSIAGDLAKFAGRGAYLATWPARARTWLVEVYQRIGDAESAAKFRSEARAEWQALSARSDLPEELRREASKMRLESPVP